MMRPAVLDDEASYYSTFLSHGNEASSPVQSQWMGKTAQWLGVHGEVAPHQFECMRDGSDPQNGVKLIKSDEPNRERGFYDITLVAPPSVTLQWLIARDERLLDAHKAAVNEALEYVENRTEAREEIRGLQARPTGNLLIARFDQTVNDQGNPELHSHCVTANMTWDSVNGEWRPIDAEKFYEAREATSEVYNNALARGLTKAGYSFQAVDTQDAKGRLELVCVPQQLRELVEHGQNTERQLRDNPDAVVPGITKRLENAKHLAQDVSGRGMPVSPETAREAVSHAVQETFARVSVTKELELFSAALRAGRGHVSVPDVQKEIDTLKDAKHLLAAGGELATKDSAQREKSMLAMVNNGMASTPPLATAPYKMPGLSPSQQDGLDSVLTSQDWAISLDVPDAQRPHLLSEISRGVAQNHKTTLALTPNETGVWELSMAGLEKVFTVPEFLNSPKLQTACKGYVFLIDDAARIGSRDTFEIMKYCRHANSKIVFARDSVHDNDPGSSDAIAVLEGESGMACIQIKETRAKPTARYEKAVSLENETHGKGFDALERTEVIKEVSQRQRTQLVAEAYLQTEGSLLLIVQNDAQAQQLAKAIQDRQTELGVPRQEPTIEVADKPINVGAVDHVLISTDQMNHDLFFDAVSKARQTCQVYTSDVEALRQSVLETSRQHTAMELAAKAKINVIAQAHTQEAGRAYDNASRASVAAAHPAQPSPAPELSH